MSLSSEQRISQGINQGINQSINQGINQSVNQSTYQSEQQGNFVAMRSGALWLFVPQSQVLSTERLARLSNQAMTEEHQRPGVFKSVDSSDDTTERVSHYAALSAEMTLLPSLPEQRFLTTVFDGSDIHWCWDEVQVLIGARIACQTLPPVLCSQVTPLESVAILDDDRRGFLCNTGAIINYALNHSTIAVQVVVGSVGTDL